MGSYPGPVARDEVVPHFRAAICEKIGLIPFKHQAASWLATDGLLIHPEGEQITDLELDQNGWPITTAYWHGFEGVPRGTIDILHADAIEGRSEVLRHRLVERSKGKARLVADLAAYKGGKSQGGAIYGAAFGIVPGAIVNLIGLTYDTCAPEFEYIVEALCSERGMNMPYKTYRPGSSSDGRMLLVLENGAKFEARSWEVSEGLKGKQADLYLYCEAYQLPGIEAYTKFSQNLAVRKGYAYFATTPDYPWVTVFLDKQKDFDSWFAIDGVARSINPFTFDQEEYDMAHPEMGGLMSTEQFSISFLGTASDFVGSVYKYKKGECVMSPETDPELFNENGTIGLPQTFRFIAGMDYGKHMAFSLSAIAPDGTLYVLAEVCNYRYITPTNRELIDDMDLQRWCEEVKMAMIEWAGTTRIPCYGDPNSQWKNELSRKGFNIANGTPELTRRTGVTLEFFAADRIRLHPDLEVLPHELEMARYPEDEPLSGKIKRMKRFDDAVDTLEHQCASRRKGKKRKKKKEKLFLDQWLQIEKSPFGRDVDPHMGK